MATHRRSESAYANSESEMVRMASNGDRTGSRKAMDSRSVLMASSAERLLHVTSRLSKRTTGLTRRTPSPELAPVEQEYAMKRLFLLHLELIQQQQEQLQAKDREIAQLTAQREQMNAKFVRMERRLALQQRRNTGGLPPSRETTRTSHVRKKNVGPSTLQANDSFWQGNAKSVKRAISSTNGNNNVVTLESPDIDIADIKEEENEQSENPYKTLEFPLQESAESERENFIQTLSLYASSTPGFEEDLHTEVKVPPWRSLAVKPKANCSNQDIEDLDDQVFLKRHNKLEMEEKRIKRWDIRRARQQIREEALKKHYQSNSHLWSTSNPDQSPRKAGGKLKTFLPSLDKMKFVEVTDSVPVSAFGQPLPFFVEPKEFRLPWFNAKNHIANSLVSKSKKSKAKLKYQNV
eukprot:m.15319 g.15319  ORF g.15319 m.15319 type:complete len:407 (+) comp26300_c0_seq2:220-1440(+)